MPSKKISSSRSVHLDFEEEEEEEEDGSSRFFFFFGALAPFLPLIVVVVVVSFATATLIVVVAVNFVFSVSFAFGIGGFVLSVRVFVDDIIDDIFAFFRSPTANVAPLLFTSTLVFLDGFVLRFFIAG